MTPNGPAHSYYRACEGQWSCPLDIRVTDHEALRTTGGWPQVLLLRCLERWPAWLGRWTLKTGVVCGPHGRVVHTTRFVWLGCTMVQSHETLQIQSDGAHFSLSGEARFGVFPWIRSTVHGRGHVEACGTKAQYTVQWMDTVVQQTSTLRDGVVTLHQAGAGFEGTHPLRAC